LSKEQIINSCDTVDDSSSLVSQCMDNHSSWYGLSCVLFYFSSIPQPTIADNY
jgi:hypothetical protein